MVLCGGTLVAFTAFAAFIRRLGWSFFCPFRVFAAVRGLWGGTLVAFTVLVVFLLGIGVGHLWHFSAFVVFMRDARWSFYFLHLFIYFCVALRLAFMGHWGGTLMAFTVLVGFYWALGLDVCGAFQRLLRL